jgi:hypothetical protein
MNCLLDAGGRTVPGKVGFNHWGYYSGRQIGGFGKHTGQVQSFE